MDSDTNTCTDSEIDIRTEQEKFGQFNKTDCLNPMIIIQLIAQLVNFDLIYFPWNQSTFFSVIYTPERE